VRLRDHEFTDPASGAVIRRITVGDLDTNCWIIIDPVSRDAMVIDPGDEAQRILDATTDVRIQSCVLTHAHWDHVLGVDHLGDATGLIPMLHPADSPVWPHEQNHLAIHGHFDAGTATDELLLCGCSLQPNPDRPLWDGTTNDVIDNQTIRIGQLEIAVIATPGHTPGSICLSIGAQIFSGDTLFPGGPGLTGWPLSDFSTIITSITKRLFTLDDETIIHPGHGSDTTIGNERPSLTEWIKRGW
jgi:hydroxyacylglutathione hydrolase